jgi:AraC family transcriptional regulator
MIGTGIKAGIETGAYGARMSGYLHLSGAPDYVRLGSGQYEFAATRLHAPKGLSGMTAPIPVEKAFSIHLHLRANQGGRLWLNGKLVPTKGRPAGGVTILDLEQEPIAFFPNAIDVLQFYIPCAALEAFAYDKGIANVDTLRWPHCEMDATLNHLGLALLFAMRQPRNFPRLFLDSMGQTVLAHATHVYGGIKISPGAARGGLAPWQARRAAEFLGASLPDDVTLASVAAECELSVSHFARAFRRTFGCPPHRWFMERRLDSVKDLLLDTRLTLAEIAAQCGYSDQPALNRSFKRLTGESPGEWRRSRKGYF